MVLRASAHQPRTMVERTEDATRRLEEQRRQQGRGSTALRNRNHVLILEPGSQSPLLTPTNTDSGIGFGARYVEVLSGDGTGYADATMRGVDARGPIQATGDVRSAGSLVADTHVRAEGEIRAGTGIRAEQGMSCGGDFVSAGRASANNFAVMGNSIFSWDYDGAIRWNSQNNPGALEAVTRSGGGYRGVIASAFADSQGPLRGGSERAMKDHVSDITGTEALKVIRRWHPARFAYKPSGSALVGGGDTHGPARLRASVYVDELDAPDTRELVGGHDEHGNRIPDDRAVTAYLVAAVQQLATALAEQRAELAALRSRTTGP